MFGTSGIRGSVGGTATGTLALDLGRALGSMTDTVVRAVEWYDGDVDRAMAVDETVAEATDRDPTAFGPLNTAVDPDAIDALVRGSDRPDGTVVSFLFDGFRVVVRGGGEVVVRNPPH